MDKATTQYTEEPLKDDNEPGKAAEQVQTEAIESANTALESSMQESALQEVVFCHRSSSCSK